jgi:hypothetical protein
MPSSISPGVGMSPRRGLRVSFQCDVATTDRIRPLSLLEEEDDVVEETHRTPPLIILQVVLENEVSKQIVQQHRSSLRELAMEQRDSFSVISNHTHNSSLRSLLSAGMHGSNNNSNNNNSSSKKWTDVQLEQNHNSITQWTEDLTEFSYSGGDYSYSNRLFADFESDQRTWGTITGYNFDGDNDDQEDDGNDDSSSYEVPQATKTNSSSSSSASSTPSSSKNRRRSGTSAPIDNLPSQIEVTPGVFVPLRGSNETWQAIKSGCTVSTHCVSCNAKLHVIEVAAMVVCHDCWMVSPVTQRLGDIPLEFDGDDNECSSTTYGIGLGVKGDDVLRWIKEGKDVDEDHDDDDVRGDN